MVKNTPTAKQEKRQTAKISQENSLPPWLEAILNPETVSYERLPMLEVIFERVTRTLSTGLRNLTSDNVEVSLSEIVSLRFGEHLDKVSPQSLIGVFTSKQWDGASLIIADSPLIYSIVNVFLGGRKTQESSKVENTKSYTTIERNLVKRLFKLLLDELELALEPLSPTKFSIDRIETSPKFATIVRPSNTAILMRLKIQMEGKGGMMELLIPYGSLEAIRPMLLEMFVGENIGHDSVWENHVSKELHHTEVSLEAVLDEVFLGLGTVVNWREGSLLPLGVTPESQVKVRCGEHSLFVGKMGQRNGNVAIFLDADYLNHSEEEEDA
ncbi:MAG: flagellar motor switch protein FliM [Alphaproteobacteria bacterium]